MFISTHSLFVRLYFCTIVTDDAHWLSCLLQKGGGKMLSCFKIYWHAWPICPTNRKIITLKFTDQRHLRSKDKDTVMAEVRPGREPHLWKWALYCNVVLNANIRPLQTVYSWFPSTAYMPFCSIHKQLNSNLTNIFT